MGECQFTRIREKGTLIAKEMKDPCVGPMALPDEDLLVVFNAWNILPGRPALPGRRVLARIVAGMK